MRECKVITNVIVDALPSASYQHPIRTLQIVQEAELSEPFAEANFRNRNVALVQKEGGITLHLQDYKTIIMPGMDRISIEVGCLLADTRYRT